MWNKTEVPKNKISKPQEPKTYLTLKLKGFVDRVKQWWASHHFQGSSPSSIFGRKLKALKVNLKV